MSNDEVYSYQQQLFNIMPGIIRWQQETRNRVMAGETLTTFTGRRRRFWLITEENKKDILNECLAFVPQSTLSDICLLSLCVLVEAGYRCRISVHDSIVVECRHVEVKSVMEVMASVFAKSARAFTTDIPFLADFKVGPNWGDISDVE
jgi:DNA polymerase I-like protein with 3'-5' exonuclease and polymerase domains